MESASANVFLLQAFSLQSSLSLSFVLSKVLPEMDGNLLDCGEQATISRANRRT